MSNVNRLVIQQQPERLSAEALIAPPHPRPRPVVSAIAVTTLNGSATFSDGTSGPLGNRTDTDLLLHLRSLVDVVLVGSATVKKENYGPGDGRYRLAILTQSFNISSDHRIFSAPERLPLVLAPRDTLDNPATYDTQEQLRSLGVEILDTHDGSPREIINVLGTRGATSLSVEGGPAIYSQFFAAGAIDYFYLTIDPIIDVPVPTPIFDEHQEFTSSLVLEEVNATKDGTLFLRYRSDILRPDS